ncbi:MAG: 50S ribosomal protein L20 [Candidatus Falkowbacteria bacterium]|nr:50S ribosomal protein L20 [Candidatus Falkowbacteria bacterium]
MPRVKRGTQHVKRRNNLLAKVKGFKWGRKNLIRMASTAATKAGVHAYTDRKKKKRTMRGLANIKIGAFAKEQGFSYSKLIDMLKKKNIELDRKVLSELAQKNKEVLVSIINKIKA